MRNRCLLKFIGLFFALITIGLSLAAEEGIAELRHVVLDTGPRWHRPHSNNARNYGNYYSPYDRQLRCYYIWVNHGYVYGGYQYVCR